MLFRKKRVEKNIVNDFDNDIVNLYVSVSEKFDEFINHIYWIPRSRKLFEDYQAEILATKGEIEIPDAKRAAMYYYVIKNAFNKNVYNVMSKAEGKKVNWHTGLVEELKWSRKMMNGVIVENLDFRELVKRYEPQEGDCWYLDPPYVVAGEKKNYYFHDFTKDDHDALKDVCDKIHKNKAKFMVSYDNRQVIKDLFKDYNVNEIKTKYSGAADKKERIELVITNYEPTSSHQTTIFSKEGGI
jgi:DNA adenine methylase